MSALPERFRNLAGQRLLVTGAAGFLGGHLFRRLASYGLDVVGTVMHPDEAEALRAEGLAAEVLDLADDASWDGLLRGFDVVFAVAAMFQEVEHGEGAYAKVNIDGARKLAETAARVGVSRFVHCSTVGVHGDVREIPATEQTSFNPMDEYHRTKLEGERAVLDLAASGAGGMTVVVNRPAMAYGPGARRMLKLFRWVLSGRFVMIGSGKVLAHLDYVEDQTESFLRCAVAPGESVHGEAFNIASGAPLTLNELVRLIAEAGGVEPPRWRVPFGPVWAAAWACESVCRPLGVRAPLFRRRVDFFHHNRAFDLGKAERLLGYRSRWDHERGIAESIDWYRKHGYLDLPEAQLGGA